MFSQNHRPRKNSEEVALELLKDVFVPPELHLENQGTFDLLTPSGKRNISRGMDILESTLKRLRRGFNMTIVQNLCLLFAGSIIDT